MCVCLFIFRGHSTREPAPSRVTYFILQAYTGTGVSHSQQRKKWVEISKEEIPGSKRSMYEKVYIKKGMDRSNKKNNKKMTMRCHKPHPGQSKNPKQW